MIKTIGLVLAAIYALVALVVNLYAVVQIFKNYIQTGKISSNNDEPTQFTRGTEFVFFKRSAGIFALITGILLDLLIMVTLIHLWFVTIPVMAIILTAVFMRLKKVRKDNFINALKGKRAEDVEWA